VITIDADIPMSSIGPLENVAGFFSTLDLHVCVSTMRARPQNHRGNALGLDPVDSSFLVFSTDSKCANAANDKLVLDTFSNIVGKFMPESKRRNKVNKRIYMNSASSF
jgi:hypothetical protein